MHPFTQRFSVLTVVNAPLLCPVVIDLCSPAIYSKTFLITSCLLSRAPPAQDCGGDSALDVALFGFC